MKFPLDRLEIVQDGAKFYRPDNSDCVYESSIVVKDGDIPAAERARQEFLRAIDASIPSERVVFVV